MKQITPKISSSVIRLITSNNFMDTNNVLEKMGFELTETRNDTNRRGGSNPPYLVLCVFNEKPQQTLLKVYTVMDWIGSYLG